MAGLGNTPASTEIFIDDLLQSEVTLITDDGTGSGEQIVLAFADHGADVAIAGRDMDTSNPSPRKSRTEARAPVRRRSTFASTTPSNG